ncbi:hypothetical protein P43SY_005003 [Pythium insidiosum]|uniref:RING-type domain-containing protein n=1 Tax=Pythium insidiosum TaxID=114742 RepID=A0AAD5MH09_PYTIN|nr:hypothetical protein P43SY_005003 [Pythium insidiosum]
MADQDVHLRCIRQGGKLRVQIISRGYFNQANCQFPRAIRAEGRVYSVPPSSIRLAQSAKGTYFYRVSQPIKIVDEHSTDEEEPANDEAELTTAAKGRGKKRSRPVEKPVKVFDCEDEPECVVCLDTDKERICVPCGHYCMCKNCVDLLVSPKKCPLCRTPIKTTILPSEL